MLSAGAVYALGVFYGVVILLTLLYFILLRLLRGSTPGLCNTIVAVMAFHHFVFISSSHTYFLYGEKLQKDTNYTFDFPPADGNYCSYVKQTIALNLQLYAQMVDTRPLVDEYQIVVKALFGYGSGLVGSLLCLLTFVGHLKGCNGVYVTQTISATWHLALFFYWGIIELLDGGKHVVISPLYYSLTFLPLVLYSLLAIGCAYCAKFGTCVAVVTSPVASPVISKPIAPPPKRGGGGKEKAKKH